MFCATCGNTVSELDKFCPKCGAPVGSAYQPASTGKRFGNYLIDTSFVVFLIFLFFGAVKQTVGTVYQGYNDYAGSVIWFLYYFICESLWQRTLGKFITKTKVVMTDGSKPDAVHIFGRTLSRILPFEPISFLFSHTWWHDKLSKTYVVPLEYTPEQIALINPKKSKRSTWAIAIFIVVFGVAVIGILASVVLVSLNAARSKARDAQRVAHVRQAGTALELYYIDHKTYPVQMQEAGRIPNIEKYLDTNLPTSPTPPDGNCSVDDNQYLYYSDGKTYFIGFCLGAQTSGLAPGYHVLGPEGFDQNEQIQEEQQSELQSI
jgi:type II secretory pathway pseudopilin PulG/uncharacterized RDD family membrane protein YckC